MTDDEPAPDAPGVPRARNHPTRHRHRVSPGGPGRMLLSIEVTDVDALLPRVQALGGHAGSGANDMPWGQRVAHVEDPNGNVVNLTHQL